METAMACQILTALIDGRDPLAGGELRSLSVLSRPEVRQSFLLGRDAILKWPKPNKSVDQEKSAPERKPIRPAKIRSPARFGAGWHAEERDRLLEEFRACVPFGEMAQRHQRSKGAIIKQLKREGLLA
jgi:hypothetical protein